MSSALNRQTNVQPPGTHTHASTPRLLKIRAVSWGTWLNVVIAEADNKYIEAAATCRC